MRMETRQNAQVPSVKPSLSILTVGDGDLSASLALFRAAEHSELISIKNLVATTLLPTKAEVTATYPASAGSILEELSSFQNVTLLYAVDATQLHNHIELKNRKFDVVLFHYPHLGYDESCTSEDHYTRHHTLLAHYFHAAKSMLSETGLLHVCLCSGAVHSWKLQQCIDRLDLQLFLEFPASRSFLEPLAEHFSSSRGEENANDKVSTITVRARKGGGSRKGHWLGRFGYRHRPTFPKKTTFSTVSSSYQYFLQPKYGNSPMEDHETDRGWHTESAAVNEFVCQICLQRFSSSSSLRAHLMAPTGGIALLP